MELSDILASVVAWLTAAGNWRDWDRGSGLIRVDCGVSAVSEDDAIATLVVGHVLLECVNIEAVIFSGVADSLSHLLSRASTAWLTAGVALLRAAVTALNLPARRVVLVPVIPPPFVLACGSLSADLKEAAVCYNDRSRGCDVTRGGRDDWHCLIWCGLVLASWDRHALLRAVREAVL